MRAYWKTVLWLAAAVTAVLGVLDLFFFEVWTVPKDDPLLSASIEPTLTAGDVVVVTRHGSVGRGDLVRCADPQAPGRFVVARAIGSFGDRVEINDGFVTLDGHRTPSPRACDPPTSTVHDPRDDNDVTLGCSVEEYAAVTFSVLRARPHTEKLSNATVDAGHWFLVSDDRDVHLDSRDYGQMDPSTCQHVVFRIMGAAGFRDVKARLSIIW
jgi:signal peptidase I